MIYPSVPNISKIIFLKKFLLHLTCVTSAVFDPISIENAQAEYQEASRS